MSPSQVMPLVMLLALIGGVYALKRRHEDDPSSWRLLDHRRAVMIGVMLLVTAVIGLGALGMSWMELYLTRGIR